MTFASKEPIVIPGQADLPSRMIRAKAMPEGGQVEIWVVD
jgi:hypothetical protein